MDDPKQAQRARLAALEKELADLKARLPEHCHGTEGYISDHRATPEHWQKIEDTEEEIQRLKVELGE